MEIESPKVSNTKNVSEKVSPKSPFVKEGEAPNIETTHKDGSCSETSSTKSETGEGSNSKGPHKTPLEK